MDGVPLDYIILLIFVKIVSVTEQKIALKFNFCSFVFSQWDEGWIFILGN